MSRKLVITICTSGSFYRKATAIKTKLEAYDYSVIVPATAEKMKKSGDYDISHYKTWFSDAKDYHKKAAYMREHFKEVERGDICLVLNYEKHGVANYIGGNVLMEMALAFYLKKPIYILNEVPKNSPFIEEILGMEPVVLKGKIEKLPKLLKTGFRPQ